jgi:hypothetical protein
MWRRWLVPFLLVAALSFLSFTFAQIPIPYAAVTELGVRLAEYGPRLGQYYARFQQTIYALIAVATGALVAREVKNKSTVLLGDPYDSVSNAMSEVGVASVRDSEDAASGSGVDVPTVPMAALRAEMLARLGLQDGVLVADIVAAGDCYFSGRGGWDGSMPFGVCATGATAEEAISRAEERFYTEASQYVKVARDQLLGYMCFYYGCPVESGTIESDSYVTYREYPPSMAQYHSLDYGLVVGDVTRPIPGVVVNDSDIAIGPRVVECGSSGCVAWVGPRVYTALYLLQGSLSAYLDSQYCTGGWFWSEVYSLVALRFVYDSANRYRAASTPLWVGSYLYLSGNAPYRNRLWNFSILSDLGGADYSQAILVRGYNAYLWGRAWAAVCGGSGVPVALPWDLPGAPDYGTAVRQRDSALVWWLVRPLEALHAAFVPRVALADRLHALSGVLAERFPFSVWYSLRSYFPAVQEHDFSLPCFVIGR